MSEKFSKRDKTHLINLIKRRNADAPNFALLIGAGASVSSGVKSTCKMVDEWRQLLYKQSRANKPIEQWLQEQDWYEDEEEYSILFEIAYDRPAQRRNYIEDCVKDARPSWGYIYLSNIISTNFFNVVLTPNFDDLLNEACFMYADCKPISCAHDSAVSSIRVTSRRPKIIKLHGDFLYDNIKNTLGETESLEKNMRDKFRQFATEYGLVVVGYGGNDKSIMDVLDLLVKEEGYFPHGVYWCLRKGGEIGKKLARFLGRENVYSVEIDGFDEFMAELHHGCELVLPDTVRDPYKATTDRLNRFIDMPEEVSHDIIRKDIDELRVQVKRYEGAVSRAVQPEDVYLPFEFLADSEARNGNFEQAAAYTERALLQNLNREIALLALPRYYLLAGEKEKAIEAAEKAKAVSNKYRGYLTAGVVLETLDLAKSTFYLSEAARYATNSKERARALNSRANALLIYHKDKEALADTEEALKIELGYSYAKLNKAIALKRLGKAAEANLLVTESIPEIEDTYTLACAYAILGNKVEMVANLEKAIKGDRQNTFSAMTDPDFEDFRKDPDFLKLLKQYSPEKQKTAKQ